MLDLVLHNGHVLTQATPPRGHRGRRARRPHRRGRRRRRRHARGRRRPTRRIDLDGRTLVPGFNDAHAHIWKIGHLLTTMLDLRGRRERRRAGRTRARLRATAAGGRLAARPRLQRGGDDASGVRRRARISIAPRRTGRSCSRARAATSTPSTAGRSSAPASAPTPRRPSAASIERDERGRADRLASRDRDGPDEPRHAAADAPTTTRR